MQSLVGLMFLAALYAVSIRANLSSIHWLLETTSAHILLATIIIFQEDIRKALARAGRILPSRFGPESDLSLIHI